MTSLREVTRFRAAAARTTTYRDMQDIAITVVLGAASHRLHSQTDSIEDLSHRARSIPDREPVSDLMAEIRIAIELLIGANQP